MDAINYGEDLYHDLISTDMLEEIPDGSQSHPNVNQREARYKKYVIVLGKENRNRTEH